MTVYVDDMRRKQRVGNTNGVWSHLFADTTEELVNFAVNRLHMSADWIQHPGTHREHFDVTDTNRRTALMMGAESISYPRGTAALMARKKAA